MEFIYGKNTIFEYLNCPKPKRELIKLILKKNTLDEKHIRELCNKKKISFKQFDNNEFNNYLKTNKLTDVNHQGIIVESSNYFYAGLNESLEKFKETENIFVILNNITDSRNFGAILRSCVAFNVNAVLIEERNSVNVNSTTSKTAVGLENYIDIIKVKNLSRAISDMKDRNFWFFGLDMNGESINKVKNKLSGNIAIVLGSEDRGIKENVKKNIDFKIKIDMNKHVDSLNASVALSIALYEVRR